MTVGPNLTDLQMSVQDVTVFGQLEDYFALAYAFLKLLNETRPTRIVPPTITVISFTNMLRHTVIK